MRSGTGCSDRCSGRQSACGSVRRSCPLAVADSRTSDWTETSVDWQSVGPLDRSFVSLRSASCSSTSAGLRRRMPFCSHFSVLPIVPLNRIRSMMVDLWTTDFSLRENWSSFCFRSNSSCYPKTSRWSSSATNRWKTILVTNCSRLTNSFATTSRLAVPRHRWQASGSGTVRREDVSFFVPKRTDSVDG